MTDYIPGTKVPTIEDAGELVFVRDSPSHTWDGPKELVAVIADPKYRFRVDDPGR